MMKKVLTLIALLCGFVGNTWSREAHFEYQMIEFSSNGTQPQTEGENMWYQQPILWTWNDGDTPFALNETQEEDFTWTVTTTGDMSIPEGHYLSKSGKDYIVNPSSKIYFRGSSGTLKITATNPDFDGVTYTCSYTIVYHMDNTKWDFYGKPLAVGRMKDESSTLHNNSSVWALTSINETEKVYFYTGSLDDNGYPRGIGGIITETEGLKFYAPTGTFGLYNESDNTGAAPDRFIALKVGAEVVIPASYFQNLSNPRIRIKMGRYGGTGGTDNNEIDLTITNGKDALGKDITGEGTYVIGGSAWWGDKKDYHQRGEYHFQLQDKNQDFKIKVHAGQWLKLYTIEVYNSVEMLSENSILGNSYQLLNKVGTEGDNGVSGTYYLHYRGKGEQTRLYTYDETANNYVLWPTGTVNGKPDNFTYNSGAVQHTYTTKVGEFGTFRIRLACYTHKNDYCTDYAYRTQSVGYLKTQNYPYTWDFTDVARFEGGPGRMGNAQEGTSNYGEGDYVYYNRWEKRNHWTAEEGGIFSHRISMDAGGRDVLFCGGSQLWYGKTMIPELVGLGFSTSNMSATCNGTLQILPGDQGIRINQEHVSWWCYRIAVPNVPADGVLYVRVHPVENAKYPIAGYSYGDYVKTTNGSNQQSFASDMVFDATDGTGDKIYVIPGNNESLEKNITLYFNGVVIKKMAVSTAPKQFNAKGWTTESREYPIDPALTSYMTGQDIRTYVVTGVDYNKRSVTMFPIGGKKDDTEIKKYLIMGTNDGGKYVSILQNYNGTTLNMVNNSFHLFVADMHETDEGSEKIWAPEGIMTAQVSATTEGTKIPATSGDYTNYAFTYKYWNLNEDGTKKSGQTTATEGEQGFYRIVNTGATSKGHQGYLPLETAKISKGTFSAPGFSLILDKETEGDQETTAIEAIAAPQTLDADAPYYSLNGLRLSGKPTQHGIYIHNGKKVVIQ